MNARRTSIAIGLGAVGIIIMIWAWYFERTPSGLPDWTPVNAPLQETLISLQPPAINAKNGESQSTDDYARDGGAQSKPSPKAAPNEPSAPKAEPPSPAALPVQQSEASPVKPSAQQTEPSSPAAPGPDAKPDLKANESRLDLNEATLLQLENLPGIGPSKAKAIIAYREQHGEYRSVEQLLEVKGIGPKMLEKLSPEVFVR
ncbi:ComEA family DNA-binding protein [Cohnella yongneupensis]|uniref:Helix-hairpin-helix domain-containing protein n=1 Tax=Cohnella yongneupensis TaxID=425006 RepID=A0ABW0R765_9BACL